MSKTTAPILATGLVVTLDDVLVKHQWPAPKTYIGIGFVAIVLSVLDGPAPEVALPLAWIVLLSVLLTRGVRLFKALTPT